MTEAIEATLILAVYRIVTLLVGVAVIYMGYRLFLEGVFRKAGDLKAAWGDKNLIIRQASPGAFFIIFGAIIIIVSLVRGLQVTEWRPMSESAASTLSVNSSEVREDRDSVNAIASTPARDGKEKDGKEKEESQPPDAARSKALSDGITISAAGGAPSAIWLSTRLRKILSDQTLCLSATVSDSVAQSRCYQQMQRQLYRVPTLQDIEQIEALEREFSARRSSDAATRLENLRRQFVREQ